MRIARIKPPTRSFFHCCSRVVEERFIFAPTCGDVSVEADYFVNLMRRLERFCGLHLLTYAVMSNHFHLVTEVPKARPLRDTELLARIEALEGAQRRTAIQEQLRQLQACDPAAAQRLRQRYLARMYDLSVFLQELKGRFAQWFNRRHGRYGVLWAERFKSTLLQSGEAVATACAYVDLNPIRAGLCSDPKDYRYSSYGQAIGAGSAVARRGLSRLREHWVGPRPSWAEFSRLYRMRLFATAVRATKGATLSVERAQKVIEAEQGAVSLGDLLGCRWRFFSNGAILGTQEFIAQQLERLGRTTAATERRAHPLREFAYAGLCVLKKPRAGPAATATRP
jgi:REP element-mobilizing transposase RayT